MTNERLHELVDLVTAANYYFVTNGIGCDCLLTVNKWAVNISVFESVNPYENATHYRDDDNDHDFIMAEKHIKRLEYLTTSVSGPRMKRTGQAKPHGVLCAHGAVSRYRKITVTGWKAKSCAVTAFRTGCATSA